MHTSSRVGLSCTLLLGAMWLNSILQYLTPLTGVLRGEAKSTHYPVKRSTDLSFSHRRLFTASYKSKL